MDDKEIQEYQRAVRRLAEDQNGMYFANGDKHISFTYGVIINSSKTSIKILVNEVNCDHLYQDPTFSELIKAIFNGIKVEMIFEDTLSPLYKDIAYLQH